MAPGFQANCGSTPPGSPRGCRESSWEPNRWRVHRRARAWRLGEFGGEAVADDRIVSKNVVAIAREEWRKRSILPDGRRRGWRTPLNPVMPHGVVVRAPVVVRVQVAKHNRRFARGIRGDDVVPDYLT